MSSDIQPGDLVVCLPIEAAASCPADHEITHRRYGPAGYVTGHIYTVTAVEANPFCGTTFRFAEIVSSGPVGACHSRFRKIQPYQERFAEQLRTSLPGHERVKEPASC